MSTLCYTQDDELEYIKFVLRNKKLKRVLDQCNLLMMLKNNRCESNNCQICMQAYYVRTLKFLLYFAS